MARSAEVKKVVSEIEAYLGYMKVCGKQVPTKVSVKQKQFQAMMKTAKDKDVYFDLAERDGKLIYKKNIEIVSL